MTRQTKNRNNHQCFIFAYTIINVLKNQGLLILSMFFLAIIALPIFAIGVLQIGKVYIQSTREERLETENLIEIMVSAKHLVWEEEGKELWVGDKMFDVASFTLKDGYYYLTGVFDEDETEMAGSLFHSIFSTNGTDILHLLLLLQCFSFCFGISEVRNYRLVKDRPFIFCHKLLPSPFHTILGPPPRG